MEYFYFENLVIDSQIISINWEEASHLRACRIQIGNKVGFTDGNSNMLFVECVGINKKEYIFQKYSVETHFNERKYKLSLALGMLDSRERFEFAVEKAVELGCSEIIPLNCEFSQRKFIKSDRLRQKAISAMVQCGRSVIPTITEPLNVDNFIKEYKQKYNFLVADISGKKYQNEFYEHDILVIIGPEGGFSERELKLLESVEGRAIIKLGERRLRAETAAIAALSMIDDV